MLPTRLALLVLLAVSLVEPATASASSVSRDFSALAMLGTPAVNSLLLTATAGALRFTEFAAGGGAMSAGAGCASVSATVADCDVADDGAVLVALQGGSDEVVAASLKTTPLFVNGGAGNDTVTAGGGADILSGAAGGDTFNGGGGDDVYADTAQVLFGTEPGDGDDTFRGDDGDDLFDAGDNHVADGDGKGNDTFSGGAGIDTADYSGRSTPLTITVAAVGPDGAAGESDVILNAERVLGGSAADTITGGPTASTLVGGTGGDTLRGGADDDQLFGGNESDATGSGDDTLDGGGGADVLRGGDGRDAVSYATRSVPVAVSLDEVANDGQSGEGDNVRGDVEAIIGGAGPDALSGSGAANTIDGGAGGDVITGGDAIDALQGGEGDDVVRARDGAGDAIGCGTGTDTVVADTIDVIAGDCEIVDRPAVAAPAPSVVTAGPGPGGGVLALPSRPATVQGGTLKPDRRGRVKATVRCPAQPSACTGSLALRTTKPAATLSTRTFTVPAGAVRTVTFTLSKRLRAKVRRGSRLKLRFEATVTGVTTAANVTVRR